jgi:ABC-type nitrate/sulfonate/bicarbonate transport system substrate-binding protein
VKRPFHKLFAGAVAAIAVVALMPSATRAESVAVGLSKLFGAAAIPIGLERGYFAAQGLDVKMVFFDSAQPIAVGVASGDVDFGVSGMSAGFFTLAAQGHLRLLGTSSSEAPGFRPPPISPRMALMTPGSRERKTSPVIRSRSRRSEPVCIMRLGWPRRNMAFR